MKEIAINQFYYENKESLKLTLANSANTGNDKFIKKPGLHFPGIALSGHFSGFDSSEIQIIGKAEIDFLNELASTKDYYSRLKTFFLKNLPCVIVSDKLQLAKEVIIIANENKIPIFYSELNQFELIKNLISIFSKFFAESFNLFGTFIEIYGVGVMLYGSQGIGKSETALALVSREHRFIADKKIKVKIHNNVLVGYSDNDTFNIHSSLLGNFEIDRMYGIERISRYHKIDLVVNLVAKNEIVNKTNKQNEIGSIIFRGIEIPKIDVPVDVGKDMSIIIEALVKSFLYKKLKAKVDFHD